MATASRRHYPHARTDALVGVAIVSAAIFVWLIAGPVFGPVKQKVHAGHLPMLYAHIAGGICMLFAGAIALRIGLTREWFRWHKPAGYTYIVGGSAGAIAALIRSFDTQHTPGISTGALAAVWIAFTAMAFRAIRNRRIEQHRTWMIRSYVAAWTFVACRFWSRAMPGELQANVNDMIWATWVMPLFLTEILLQWRAGSRLNRS
ncbi:hypothetical protein GCM10023264_27990 [Sphingomonas daechungensis]|uniref:DUF2306 domain-containing protein n=1 Tax=Sphingomonas daechungensis TaxID=1176646 RepID=A0ABX6T0H1_9SPHN|nr:DUF2306 domain-containing protein [Sphingomonas daechungensis]QNP43327.1 DUF2306 domain-containing protein [Sphingomonas daechungensis]